MSNGVVMPSENLNTECNSIMTLLHELDEKRKMSSTRDRISQERRERIYSYDLNLGQEQK